MHACQACQCMYICICMFACMYGQICVCMCAWMCVCIDIACQCKRVWMFYVCMWVCVCVSVWMYNIYIYVCMGEYVTQCAFICMYIICRVRRKESERERERRRECERQTDRGRDRMAITSEGRWKLTAIAIIRFFSHEAVHLVVVVVGPTFLMLGARPHLKVSTVSL